MTTSGRPLLPSLQSLLHGERRISEPCSPLLDIMKSRFNSDDQGVIHLPPLSGGIPRPKSVDSALRHTMMSQITKPEPRIEPSTPLPKNNSVSNLNNSSKKNDMLTPLSAARAMITPSTNDKKRAFAFITHSQETFPKKEPKIDNAPLARRKRRRTSTQELRILQAEFERCSAPDKQKRQELADKCNMSVKAIQIWFQNKRQALKKQRISISKTVTPIVEDNKELGSEKDIHITPLANKMLRTPENDSKHSVTNEIAVVTPREKGSPLKSVNHEVTPTRSSVPRSSPSIKRGQALTFHLTSDKKLLTPVKTSPNTRVNRLINGTPDTISPFGKRSRSNSHSTSKPRLDQKKIPLRELNVNTMVH